MALSDEITIDAALDNVSGVWSAQRYMLVKLVAMLLCHSGGLSTARALRNKMLEQFDKPQVQRPDVDAERVFTIQQLAMHELEEMWAMVEDLIRQADEEDRETAAGPGW